MVFLGESRCVQSRDPVADTDFFPFPDEPTTVVSEGSQPRFTDLLYDIANPSTAVVLVFRERQPLMLRLIVRYSNGNSVTVPASSSAEDFLAA